MTPQETATLCRAMGNEARMRLLDLIIRHQGALCVQELEERLAWAGHPLNQSTISWHLQKLYRAGLVGYHKRGLYEYYFVRQEALARLSGTFAGYVEMGSEVLV